MTQAAHSQIEEFLRRNPEGTLWVMVGYASAFGLRWLNERTQGRRVMLLIGDSRTGFRNFSEEDRQAAIAFVGRPEVRVTNWYRRHGVRAEVHAKAWMVQPNPAAPVAGAVLVGSANLTKEGLFHNIEMLTVAPESEHARLYDEIQDAMDKSWDLKEPLLERLGVSEPHASSVSASRPAATGASSPRKAGPPARRSRSTMADPSASQRGHDRSSPDGWLGILLLLAAAVLLLIGILYGLYRAFDRLISPFQPQPAEEVDTGSAAPEAAVEDSKSAVSGAEAEDAALRAPDAAAPDSPSVEPCPYLTAAGEDACPLLDSLHGVDSTPCDALPVDERPLRLAGEENPAGYQVASYVPDLVCTWMSGGAYVAGDTIPAGDLRSVNSTTRASGTCQFDVRDDAGQVIMSRDTYSGRWVTHSLIRLQSGDEITTGGCGWVPARAARLDPGSVLSSETVGDYPLLIGVDIEPGVVRIECPFLVWPATEPPDGRSWDAALAQTPPTSHVAGPYNAQEGLIRLAC